MSNGQQVQPRPDSTESTPALARLGPYRVVGRLGKGGMADVLLTFHDDAATGIKRLVVVKRVLPELAADDPLFIQMFLDEARLAARLNHMNVIQTYEVGLDEDQVPYLAMEFLEGQSLNATVRRALTQGKQLPVGPALRMFCDVLAGLHYAHELRDFDGSPLGVVHRDVTPSNIFVKYDGVTKLVDFGIAKSAAQNARTRAGMLKGKLAYMAPEQLADQRATRAVDVWAMGVVIWETLSGHRLFRRKTDLETMDAIMGSSPIPSLTKFRPDIPPALDEVLAAALHRDPAQRIQTAEEFKNRLEDVALDARAHLRHGEVAKLMDELFQGSAEENRRLVRDFLERRAQAEAGGEGGEATDSGSGRYLLQRLRDRESSVPSSRSLTSIPPPVMGERPSATSSRATSPPPSNRSAAEKQTIPVPAPPADPTGAVAVAADDDEIDEARPWWHRVFLAVGVVGFLLALWIVFLPQTLPPGLQRLIGGEPAATPAPPSAPAAGTPAPH